jgi:hypothetical protein
MSDLQRTLRDALASLPEPDPAATDAARAAVLAAIPRRPRRTRRLALATVVLAAALAGAFAAGLALAPGSATTRADGPGFLPASGWETFQTGLKEAPAVPTATAANVPLGRDVLAQTFPWLTVATLGPGQILLQANFSTTGEVAGVDAVFPARSLPLSLDDAQSGASLEGQPANVTAYRLDARVNGWNLELFVFLGGRHVSPAARAAAQEELRRLVVPEGPPGPLDTRPALRPSRGACPAGALRTQVRLQGATGTLLGSVLIRNVSGRACSLRGRPHIELRDANGVLLNSREQDAPPLWRQLGAARPAGWPTVRIPAHGTAQVSVQLSNWCVVPAKPVFFRTYLPGVGNPIPAPARITLRCDQPNEPVLLRVGPVEPPKRG